MAGLHRVAGTGAVPVRVMPHPSLTHRANCSAARPSGGTPIASISAISIPGADQLLHQASEERGLQRLDAVVRLRLVLTERTDQVLGNLELLGLGECGRRASCNPQLEVERKRASKLRTRRLARRAGRHSFGTPTRKTSKTDARSRRVEIMFERDVHEQCAQLTQMHHIGHDGIRAVVARAACLRLQTRPHRQRVVGRPLAVCSVHGPRVLRAHELIACALVSSGASCSVRTRTVNQHVGSGERVFLPSLRLFSRCRRP